MKKILFRESSLKKDCRTIPVMLLGLMLILFPLQIISQETDIGKVVTENVETAVEGAEETQEAVEDTVPRLVQPDEIGPSLDEAIQEGEQKSSLEELLAVPFDQIKDGGETADSTGETEDIAESEKGDLPEPTEPQQSLAEQNLEEKLDVLLQELLPQEYVGVTVSIKYFIETVPVSKNLKKIAKIKLPGFDNHVWVPTKSKQIVGIVNQTRSYTTVFVVVNTPISPFNIEVLRQSLSEKLKEIKSNTAECIRFSDVSLTSISAYLLGVGERNWVSLKLYTLLHGLQSELGENEVSILPRKLGMSFPYFFSVTSFPFLS